MMESSLFSDSQPRFDMIEQLDRPSSTCDTFRVKLYGKLHFLKRLKQDFSNDIRYQEAFRKEFETGYCLEHPNLVRYVSLSDDGILMEYIDGETFSERLANHPDYFNDRKNTDKFLRQLLSVVSYLHSHQVLHLDIKPDNILLTRLNNDVKIIDLGCCYTDTFTDTQGRTNSFAAPEQLAGEQTDVRTDIFAIGRILELLPNHQIYNKVIARCTAPDPSLRYQTVEDVLHDINSQRRYYLYVAIFVAIVLLLSMGATLLTHRQDSAPITQESSMGSNNLILEDSVFVIGEESVERHNNAVLQNRNNVPMSHHKDEQAQYNEELTRLIDQTYCSTIATFNDSVFPPPTSSTGKSWAAASTEFHNKVSQIADRLAQKYPNIPESSIRQETEMRFQSLASSVFNQMRNNGRKQK